MEGALHDEKFTRHTTLLEALGVGSIFSVEEVEGACTNPGRGKRRKVIPARRHGIRRQIHRAACPAQIGFPSETVTGLIPCVEAMIEQVGAETGSVIEHGVGEELKNGHDLFSITGKLCESGGKTTSGAFSADGNAI